MFARVVVDTGATSAIDWLTYEIPDGPYGRIGLGSCVLVPLSTRQAVGFVIGLDDVAHVENVRPIIAEIESPIRLTREMLEFAGWISRRYLCSLAHTVAAMLPGVMKCRVQARVIPLPDRPDQPLTSAEREMLTRVESAPQPPTLESLYAGSDRATAQRALRSLEAKGAVTREWRLLPPTGKPRVLRGVQLTRKVDASQEALSPMPPKQADVIRTLSSQGRPTTLVELVRRFGLSNSALSALRKKGLLEDISIALRRSPEFALVSGIPEKLSHEQDSAVNLVNAALDSRQNQAFLLHGVTASGKTEVYLHCIEHALSLGKTAIVLLPEIAITTQVMNVFRSRFGDAVAVLHSALSAGERCDEWIRAAQGEARVIVGARSAVFAPVANLGLVVVDEEHEPSYKQDSQPRYHAREAAAERARRSNAVLILGSATPSVESYYRAQQGDYTLIEMPTRVESRPLPTVGIADLRDEYVKGQPTIFSALLEEKIRDRLAHGRQVILLQNRRAFSTFLLCRDCGYVAKCPNCSVSLKFHNAARLVKCHHCAYERPAPTVCPNCSGQRIKTFGIGTQRVEEETRKTFPQARVLRMDRDTTSRKGAHAAILNTFGKGEADILVGTQMIAKGLDFPNVTLVGMISADTSLHFPDFCASERTFQLISQVSGRAGRGPEPGEVVIQTFDPDQCAIRCAVNHDYRSFYRMELEERRMGYPPFASLVNVVAQDRTERTAEKRLLQLRQELNATSEVRQGKVDILGPMPATLERLRGHYRWHLVLRSADRDALTRTLATALDRLPMLRRHLALDVDPVSML